MSLFEAIPPQRYWPYFKHVFFDCDSTLSRIEGIDELSSHPETKRQVEDLTHQAMDGKKSLDSVYGERLEMISPSKKAVRNLKHEYKNHLVPDAEEVISLLTENGCHLYIVSGGLLEPVREFGASLGIPVEHIRAVEIEFNELSGRWWEPHSPGNKSTAEQRYFTYKHSALSESNGKSKVISELKGEKPGLSLLVGDGVSDLLARDTVDRFIGFGGVTIRKRVKDEADVFVQNNSLLPLLPLALGKSLYKALDPTINQQIRSMLKQAPLIFSRESLNETFQVSFPSLGLS